MAQEPCIGLYKPCINLPFGDCAMYFDHKVYIYILYNSVVESTKLDNQWIPTTLEFNTAGRVSVDTGSTMIVSVRAPHVLL